MSSRTAAIAVATMTLARDPAEERLLRRALTALSEHRWPMFVCDAGSGHAFLEFLRRVPGVNLVAAARPGLVGQVQASLTAAARATAGTVLYTESDKVDFFERHLRGFLSAAGSVEGAGCVLASRSAAAFSTFPATQQLAEGTINRLCGEFLELEGDYSYGPFLMRADLVAHVESVGKDSGWGWRHYIFAVAKRLGRPPVHVVNGYECPLDQRHENGAERLHRLRQLGQNVNGLLAGLTIELNP